MATARGTRDVPVGRELVWTALSRPTTYCSVCDVSYVFDDAAAGDGRTLGPGSRFVCASGQLDGAEPPSDAMAGQIVSTVLARAERVDGHVIGSHTARYYWPSAVIREFIAVSRDNAVINVLLCAGLAALPPAGLLLT